MDKGNRKVLVTGTLGQDGANMCEYLLRMPDYKVFGMIRRVANPNFVNCKAFLNNCLIPPALTSSDFFLKEATTSFKSP